MSHSAAPAHSRPEARYPLIPVSIGLLLVSLCLIGFGAFRHFAPKPPAPPTAKATHGKAPARVHSFHSASSKTPLSAPPAPDELAFQAMLAGGVGLLLSALTALGLIRSIQTTQYRTMHSILDVERAAWEKKRNLMDDERDQLSARLRETQQSKEEIDSLRHHASRQFQEFFRTLPIACFCFAADGKIVRWNEAAEKLYGISADEALRSTLWNTLVPAQEREAMEGYVRRSLAGEVLLDLERRDQRCGGISALVRFSMVPLYDAGGIVGGLSAGVDITRARNSEQQAAAEAAALSEAQSALQAAQAEAASHRDEAERLRSLLASGDALPGHAAPFLSAPDATRDTVSGLCHPQAFGERLREEAERAHRYNTPLSVIALDLDGFTRYNAACGYAAGDLALRTAAEVIGSKLRAVDVATRYSADSYTVLLPETGEAGARIAAERLLSGIAGTDWAGPRLTACCGFALLTPDVPDADTLLTRALDALTRAKSLGPGTLAQSGELPAPATKTVTRRLKKEKAA